MIFILYFRNFLLQAHGHQYKQFICQSSGTLRIPLRGAAWDESWSSNRCQLPSRSCNTCIRHHMHLSTEGQPEQLPPTMLAKISHVSVIQLHVHTFSYRKTANKPLELKGESCAQPHSNHFAPLTISVKADTAACDVVVQVALHCYYCWCLRHHESVHASCYTMQHEQSGKG